MADYIFGEIPDINENDTFKDRKALREAKIHLALQAGIDGNKNVGSPSIVLSGGYEDDQDLGDEIIYTGHGGKDQNTRKQIADQSWDSPGNAGLLKSQNEGLPVRVSRGSNHKSKYSPKSGYTYAGLYSVVDSWEEIGRSGFKICRFKLIYSGTNNNRNTAEEVEVRYSAEPTKRKESTILRIVRDSKIAHNIKKLYDFKCQVCNISIPTKTGNYAEGAHIKPLGIPHNGHDSSDNLICLCPNHHVMFDKGIFSINDDLTLIGAVSGELTVHTKHDLNKENLKYHRETHGYN